MISFLLAASLVFRVGLPAREAWPQLKGPGSAGGSWNANRLSAGAAAAQAWGAFLQSSRLFKLPPDSLAALSRVLADIPSFEIPSLDGVKDPDARKTDILTVVKKSIQERSGSQAAKKWEDAEPSALRILSRALKDQLRVSRAIAELEENVEPLESSLKYIGALAHVRDSEKAGRIDRAIRVNFEGAGEHSESSRLEEGGSTPPEPVPVSKGDRLIWTPDQPPLFLAFQKLDQVGFGGKNYDRVMFTTTHDIPRILSELLDQSQETQGNYYNFNLPPMTEAIHNSVRQLRKQTWIGDYSNTYPDQSAEPALDINDPVLADEIARRRERNAEIQKLIELIDGRNMSLRILKGLGSSGLNHNKFMLLRDKSGKQLLAVGSFNYTQAAQKNQYNSVALVDDPDVIDLFKAYFQWMHASARDFVEGMPPETPQVDPRTLPRDSKLKLRFEGKSFPQVAFSPQGDVLDWEMEAARLAKSMRVAMFAYFPPEPLEELITQLLQKSRDPEKMLIIADAGQAHNETALLKHKRLGARVLLSAGPDEAPYDPKNPHDIKSMMHLKSMIWNRLLLKGHDSSNVSKNAVFNSFENTLFWTGIYVDIFADYILNVLAPLSYEPTEDELIAIIRANELRARRMGRIILWNEGEPMAHPSVP